MQESRSKPSSSDHMQSTSPSRCERYTVFWLHQASVLASCAVKVDNNSVRLGCFKAVWSSISEDSI
eukprot:6178787-Amphidinium_carterae.1